MFPSGVEVGELALLEPQESLSNRLSVTSCLVKVNRQQKVPVRKVNHTQEQCSLLKS